MSHVTQRSIYGLRFVHHKCVYIYIYIYMFYNINFIFKIERIFLISKEKKIPIFIKIKKVKVSIDNIKEVKVSNFFQKNKHTQGSKKTNTITFQKR